MNKSLLTQSLIKFLSGVILVGILIFLPAGSFSYWQGWLFMGVLFVPMFVAGLILMIRNPYLLRKRLAYHAGLRSMDGSHCPYGGISTLCGSAQGEHSDYARCNVQMEMELE